jgi:Zn-dependent peptidase ImmA (M78 family)/transcriptional regulator with XRE-family HTH domain
VFTPSRLALARQRRGLTKKRVAELIGVSTRSMTGFEAGDYVPSDATIAKLSEALDFPTGFFEAEDLEVLPDTAVSFRSLRGMTASQRHAALAAGALAFALHDWISARFRLPGPAVPALGPGVDPETAAQVVRAEWGLGEKPAPNMIHLLEARGVRVFSLAQECHEVDAFSLSRCAQPFVFLNTQKSGEHSRFDAAHELGHLVLHWHHDLPQGKQAEHEANRFASAFLLPAASLLSVAPRFPTLKELIAIKRPWKVSVAALAHRLYTLGAVSEWQYRSLFVELSKRGYRTREPSPINRETSQILNKVFASLRAEGVAKADIARQLNLHSADLDALVFGLAMLPVGGRSGRSVKAQAAPSGPPLRLVT